VAYELSCIILVDTPTKPDYTRADSSLRVVSLDCSERRLW
jgi:hypothetical protein